jgi:hypothetical protein
MQAIFDARGYPVAWLDPVLDVVRDRRGAVIAWLDHDAAFNKRGRMLCWHQDGVLYLRDGVVAALGDCVRGPLKPRLREPGRPPNPRAVTAPRSFSPPSGAPPMPDRWSSVTWQDVLDGTY